MWTRVSVKTYAKDFLRKHYWKAFIVCLIVTVLSGDEISSRDNNRRNEQYNPRTSIEEMIEDQDSIVLDSGYKGLNRFLASMGLFPLKFLGMGIFAFMIILWVVITLFLSPLLKVGKNRFFLNGFKGDVDIKYLVSTFNSVEFWDIFKCMFITGIFNFLWYLLLIIPGIIKSYEYRMVPYLLTKESNLTASEAISRSRSMTDGEKWNMFVLDLSFIGWYILGGIFFGIGGIFVTPYHEASFAKLYNILSGNDDIDDIIVLE